jgi:alginate O-acetyltransferase complex protein AlgI
MTFVSYEFAVLIASVITLLLAFPAHLLKKLVLLGASCAFYAFWDWRLLGLLLGITALDYAISVQLGRAEKTRTRKALLLVSIVVNLGVLGIFKYANFFIDSLNHLLEGTGVHLETVHIILPIGISFYTFETLSYVIDIYHRRTAPAKSVLDYAIFVTFFPRLVAGPIMRASQFLPQLDRGIGVSKDGFTQGLHVFLRGMFKKVVVADHLSLLVVPVFEAPEAFASSTLWLAVFAYSIQILCDFSGYTDMARGVARALGFELPVNFNSPYTAQSITEFWQRWHISLSTWLRDYLYIPLGGNRRGPLRTYANLMITMLLGGLWHGASWNFVLWGGIHGTLLATERAFLRPTSSDPSWASPVAWVRSIIVFLLVSLTWIFFRAASLEDARTILFRLFIPSHGISWIYFPALLFVPAVIVGALLARAFKWEFPEFRLEDSKTPAVLLIQALSIYYFCPLHTSPFIYFQF